MNYVMSKQGMETQKKQQSPYHRRTLMTLIRKELSEFRHQCRIVG